jgi:hypothetical protein
MNTLGMRSVPRAAGASVIAVILALGCSDDTGLSKRYPVYGRVSFQGAPVAKGRIDFHPVDPGKCRPASGEIRNGSYSLTTLSPDDGALPGEYKVTVSSTDVDNSKVIATVKARGGGGRQQDIARATHNAKSLVPKKYSLRDTSDLTATVQERSNSLDFQLKGF